MNRVIILLVAWPLMLRAADCGKNGIHLEINVKPLQITYSGVSVKASLSALAKMGIELSTVQTASEETQRVNQYIQALVVGFNNCVISKDQYIEATRLILPRAKQDMAAIEILQAQISKGQKVTEGRLRKYVQSYLENLKDLAVSAGGFQKDVNRLQNEIAELRDEVTSLARENERRIEREADVERQRQTPPDLDVYLVPVSRSQINLVIDSKNRIPFEYQYSISLVGVMMSFQPFYPANAPSPTVIPLKIGVTTTAQFRIRVDLQFTYKSLSYDELHLPGHVGVIKKRYYLSPDCASWYRPQLGAGDFAVGDGPFNSLFDGENVWISNANDDTVTKLSADDGAQRGVYDAGSGPTGMCYDGSDLWVGSTSVLRRSRKLTHFCSIEVAHTGNGIERECWNSIIIRAARRA